MLFLDMLAVSLMLVIQFISEGTIGGVGGALMADFESNYSTCTLRNRDWWVMWRGMDTLIIKPQSTFAGSSSTASQLLHSTSSTVIPLTQVWTPVMLALNPSYALLDCRRDSFACLYCGRLCWSVCDSRAAQPRRFDAHSSQERRGPLALAGSTHDRITGQGQGCSCQAAQRLSSARYAYPALRVDLIGC